MENMLVAIGRQGNLIEKQNVSDSTAVQVTALIMAGGTLIAYIIGEGMTDAQAYIANEDECNADYAAFEKAAGCRPE